MLVVVFWRGLSELLLRKSQLSASGELACRLDTRRTARIGRALGRVGLPAATGLPVRVHAAVYVGSVSLDDPDDVALLEGAMRRAARDRVDRGDGAQRVRTDRGALAEPEARVRARAQQLDGVSESLGQWWPVPLATVGVVVTFVAIVRPLADAAPWLALAGISIVAIAWIASRQR